MAENVEEDNLSRKETMALFSIAVLVFFVSAVFVFTFLSWDDGSNGNGNGSFLPPPPPPNTSGNGSVVPIDNNGSVENDTNASSLWICGNGKQDPYEDCISCPEDLGSACDCASSSGSVSGDLGEEFSLCFDQKAFVDVMTVEFAVKTKPSFKISFPDGSSKTLALEQGVPKEFVYRDGDDTFGYSISLKEEVFHGVVLVLDNPIRPKDEEFFVEEDQKVIVEDTGLEFSFSLLDPSNANSSVELKIDYDGDSSTRIVDPPANVSVGPYIIYCEKSVDLGVVVTVFEGDA